MTYRFEEYCPEFIVGFKSVKKDEAEKYFVKFIFSLLNSKVYQSIEAFREAHPTFDSFINLLLNRQRPLNMNHGTTVCSHFKGPMADEDYQKIINSIIKLTQRKKDFDSKNIIQTNLNQGSIQKNIVSYVGDPDNQFHLINQGGIKLEEKHGERKEFQTTNPKENATNMFKDLSESVNETLKFVPIRVLISQLDQLNEQERDVIKRVLDYFDDIEGVEVDVYNHIAKDKDNNMIAIDNYNNENTMSDDNSNNKSDAIGKGYQKVLFNGEGIAPSSNMPD